MYFQITPLWSADIMLHEHDLVRDLHCDFIKSGARVITLNTYTATPHRLKKNNKISNIEDIHKLAMSAATEAIHLANINGVKIAGCLPPLVASYHPDVAPSFQDSLDAYRYLVELQTPASDLFLCETMASISEAKAACIAGMESNKPVWVALTVDEDDPNTLRSGEPLTDALKVLDNLGAEAILLNCNSPEAINFGLPTLKSVDKPIGAYANAFVSVSPLQPGETVENLEARQDLSPDQYATYALGWVDKGASIIGGCCEVNPEHIKALYELLCEHGLIQE